jgi:DNA-binding CsgD family transcriptional regulator
MMQQTYVVGSWLSSRRFPGILVLGALMTVAILVVYLVTLGSFVPSVILSAYLWFRNGVPLAANFLKFQATYLLFLACLSGAFVVLSVAPERRLETEVLFNTVFFLLYAGLLLLLARFLFELLQRPWEGAWRRTFEVVAVMGVALPLGIHALVYGGEDRALVLRVVLNGGYFVAFLAGVSFLFVRGALARRTLIDEWKRTTLAGACLIYAAAIPFFLVDALWPWLQVGGWIPRGLNVQVVPAIAWNLWFAHRWFGFPVHDTGAFEGVPSPRLMATMTAREQEIALLILKGRSNQEISEALGVTVSTTKNHIYNIFNKTGASSRQELGRMLQGA